MLKDITLGQYFPGSSPLHRMDPRTKIIITLIYVITLFFVKNFSGFGVFFLFIALSTLASKISFKFVVKGLKPLLFVIVFTGILNIFMTGGEAAFTIPYINITATWEGIRMAAFMILRLVLLIFGTSLLTLTTSPISLTDGIEALLSPLKKIKMPVHELSMMMTIAIRFIPTILEETDKIMKAQTARGADFKSGNVFKRAKALVPILVPLFIGAFRRADELSMAMETRCYNGGDGRTKLKSLKLTAVDGWCFAISILFLALGTFTGYMSFLI